MHTRCDYDLVVLGSGSAAFAAAIRARDLARSVVLVERATVGGTCVNIGCIPSKSLLASSIQADPYPGALAHAMAVKTRLVEQLRSERYIKLLNEYGIELRVGQGRIADAHTVLVDSEQISAQAILIATGARPAIPPIPGLEAAGYLTSTSALELTDPPRRLAVIGAGSIGLELGQMLANFGTQVTFIDSDRLAPLEEPEISQTMRTLLEGAGHTVLERTRIQHVRVESGEHVIEALKDGRHVEVRADRILVATGRTPNSQGLSLQQVGVSIDQDGAVIVDADQRTSVPSIYAAGDVTNQPRYVYVAAAAGAAAAQNALGGAEPLQLDFSNLPRVTFTTPQIAAAGLTEQQARGRGLQIETRVLSLDAVPRGLVNGNADGLFKLIAERNTGRLLGASLMAPSAGEVIQSVVLAIDQGMTVGELAATWAPYLTISEGLKLTAQTFHRDVAKLSCCAA